MKVYLNLFFVFFRIGLFTFGGGYAMIPLIEKELVTNKKWIHEEDMIDIFAIAQSIPGAIAINTSTLVGYKIAGKIGAVFATLGVILPSFTIITIIATFFVKIADLSVVEAIFTGINGAVVVLVFLAAKNMIKAAVIDKLTFAILCVTVIMMVLTDISPIFLIMAGSIPGIISYLRHKNERDV